MYTNYFLTALRNLPKQPAFTAIKILSLTLGLVCSILVIMHVQYSYSYDKHIPDWQNIYRLVTSFTTDQRLHTGIVSDAYVPPLVQDYQQIDLSVRILEGNGMFSRGEEAASNVFLWVDPQIIELFSLDFLQGDPQTALTDTNTVVLDQTTARKYFGDTDPIGQVLRMDNLLDLRVTGVIRDMPGNTHIQLPAMIAIATGQQMFGQQFMNSGVWAGFNGTRAYVRLPGSASADAINKDLANFVQRNVPEQQRDFVTQIDISLELEPLADIYLSPRQASFSASGSNRVQVLTGLVIFAMLILLTSCINFGNLSLSQAQQRGKEIGVRKTLGANRAQIITQFLFESVLLTLIALLVSLPLVYLAIPVYTALTATGFTAALLLQSSTLIWLVLFVLLTGLLSGLVPALTLSRFEAVLMIKGLSSKGKLSRYVRSAITVLQFSLATALVILAVGITVQINHLSDMELGFNRSNLVVLDSRYNPRTPDEFNYEALVNELRDNPAIINVARAQVPPPSTGGYNPARRPEWPNEDLRPVSHYSVDEFYLDTMQFQLLAGRNFSRDFMVDYIVPGQPPVEDHAYGAIITEYAVSNFGFGTPEEALDQELLINDLRVRVVGVISDFRLAGGMEDVLRSTSILRAVDGPARSLLVRIDPARQTEALAHIDSVWAVHRPDVPINRTFYEQTYEQLIYEDTNGISMASLFAAIITISIAALGLYALAFYSTQRRTKEVGVRKVLGASSASIIGLLTWDFVKPVLIACVLAIVGGYFAVDYFFAQYSSRAELPLTAYLLVTLGTVLIAVLTVALQCYRTASSDPVLSLRYE